MVTEIKLPKLGETMEEGTISKWRKKEGEKVERGEILFEVMTDKANFEVEAPDSGVIRKILAKEDEVVQVTKTIGFIASSMDEPIPEASAPSPSASAPPAPVGPVPSSATQVSPATPPTAPSTTQAPSAATPVSSTAQAAGTGDRIKASPLARRLAEEKGINLLKIKGTGPGGRIEKEDVLAAGDVAVRFIAQEKEPPQAASEGAITIPATGVRKIIAERMLQSKLTIPHFYLTIEADMTAASEIREQMKKDKQYFSHNDLIIKAAANALRAMPVVNGFFINDRIVYNPAVNIGIAVSRTGKYKDSSGAETELFELVVPVLKDADKKTVLQIAPESKELIQKARDNKLSLAELTGGTITLSNLGTMGVDVFNAIINPPQATILAFGEIKKRPSVVGDAVVVRQIVKLNLSCDHRIVDGALGAQFLKKIKETLENPKSIL